MDILGYVLIAVAGLFILLVAVVLIRAAFFTPKKGEIDASDVVSIDKEKAVISLQKLIQCRTVSSLDKAKEDDSQFTKLKQTLRSLYPAVFDKATYLELSPRAILFHLAGKNVDKKKASVFMAHFDVVDVVDKNWKQPPFEGVRKDGELWGRGTIDTKGTLNGVLRAAEELLEKGFTPEHDFYFAFAGDEEIAGGSAKLAVKYFQKNGIEPIIVIDEGGAVVNGIFPGVNQPIACIGTAEKGACALEFHLDGEGGHASAPKAHTPVGKLAKLAVRIENHPFRMHLTAPVKEMFDILGRRSSFGMRIIFANLWLFKPLIGSLTKKSGGQLNALVRTTAALTMMQGSPVTNVIPSSAMIGLNMRLMSPDTVAKATDRLSRFAKKEGIPVSPVATYSWNPSRISTTQGEGYQKLSQAIKGTWGDSIIVTPYMMTACADARFYGEISDKVYRFSAMKLFVEQIEMIHGDNERLSDDQIAQTVEFYYRLMKSL